MCKNLITYLRNNAVWIQTSGVNVDGKGGSKSRNTGLAKS